MLDEAAKSAYRFVRSKAPKLLAHQTIRPALAVTLGLPHPAVDHVGVRLELACQILDTMARTRQCNDLHSTFPHPRGRSRLAGAISGLP